MTGKNGSSSVGRFVSMGNGALRAAALLCLLVATGAAYADDGFFVDLSTLLFNYEATNPNALPGEVIGELTISEQDISTVSLQKVDLGPDGKIGGGDDVLLDLARIGLGESFDTWFGAEVIKEQGNNNYTIAGVLKATDTVTSLDDPSLIGDFVSTEIFIFEGGFLFAGPWSPADGRDAILQPGGVETWEFRGISGDTPPSPDGDGVRGQVSLLDGRSAFDDGKAAEFHIVTGIRDLDTFFQSDRRSLTSDIKATVVPEPGTLALLLVGALALRRSKRR